MSKQVLIEELRAKELAEFMTAMLDKMQGALDKDPTRALRPWDEHSRKFLRSRLLQEHNEWLEAATLLEGRYIQAGLSSEETDSRELTRSDITPILLEMEELLDVANFCFFQWTKLRNEIHRLGNRNE